ncbi:MAG TPA: glycoside hydrolase family 99-like domain-containing protein [Sandaracinaceae bacterium LLY-WYZ-13_1]|nr:glycoside hydrolase family 99-like domain-containing protein [Sandaracinaceae bacterium LLY-WYZ-13_1]
MRIATYVYPGWHPIPERDRSFHPGFTEWELVEGCRPRFEGHHQPRVPRLGTYDDRDPAAVARRVRLALDHGVDAFVYGFFWCRGKRVFQDALDHGFLGSELGRSTPFAVMWANRMPRRVLPVRRADRPVIDEARLVRSDVDDFVALVATLAERYFAREHYLRVGGEPYFSIFDATFFLRELGLEAAAEAIAKARAWLAAHGFGGMHLAAIDPNAEVIGRLADVGFDSVTHYVFLPDWKGPRLQDYDAYARLRATQWDDYAARSGLPYVPSVAPGWDASPRAADFGRERPGKYPWSPVVVGEHPERFHDAMARAVRYAERTRPDEPLAFVASLNEWSEGHYLEPDERFGTGWLEAIAAAR